MLKLLCVQIQFSQPIQSCFIDEQTMAYGDHSCSKFIIVVSWHSIYRKSLNVDPGIFYFFFNFLLYHTGCLQWQRLGLVGEKRMLIWQNTGNIP